MGHVSTTPKIADLDSMQFLLGGGGQSSDLNDSFAATTPANKPVFKKVFGDTTTWETEVGVMTFSFVFDPKAAYDQGAIMASAWSDPFSAFQEEVQRHLLNPDDLAPMASEEEVVWQHIRNNVPSELLAMHVTSIDSYLEMLTNRAKKEYHELVEFTDALKTRAFDFAVAIAIDAYPVPKAKRLSRSSSPSEDENGGPKGVVTLHIKHTLGKAGSSDDEAAAGATNGDVTGTPSPLSAASAPCPTHRTTRSTLPPPTSPATSSSARASASAPPKSSPAMPLTFSPRSRPGSTPPSRSAPLRSSKPSTWVPTSTTNLLPSE